MTPIIQSFSEISARYDAVFCDLWGCLHNGVAPFTEAVDALRKFRGGGGKVILLTNAPRPRAAVRGQLDMIGVPADCWDDIATSGDASQAGMAAGLAGSKIYHIGPEKDLTFFTDFPRDIDAGHIERVPLQAAEGIICTGLFDDRSETPDDYRATLLYAKQKGMVLICTNPDLVVDFGAERVWCAGAIAALYTQMGGTSLYFGKPHAPIYDLARLRLYPFRDVPDDRILCIGDGIATDIQGGMSEGLDTLFITGGLAAEEFGPDRDHPDPALLDAWLAAQKLSPSAAIASLR